MNVGLCEHIAARLPAVQSLYHRLLLVGGASDARRSEVISAVTTHGGWPLLNLGTALSERLLDVPVRHRGASTPGLVAELLNNLDGDTLCVDRIEILFAPNLAQDPVGMLQGLSRNRTLIVSWPGRREGTTLLFAEPGHPEYYKQSIPDLVYVEMLA